jgi:hypothetical protein
MSLTIARIGRFRFFYSKEGKEPPHVHVQREAKIAKFLHATEAQRNHWELLGDGVGIHWDEIDEDLSVAGLLQGTPAPAAAPGPVGLRQ